ATPAGTRSTTKLSAAELMFNSHDGLVASSCVPKKVSRFVVSARNAGVVVLRVWTRALAVLAPRMSRAADAESPGTLTVFVASVGVSALPDTDQSCAPPSRTDQTVPSH